jgi:hypothetical protein
MQTRIVATGHVVHQREGRQGVVYGKAFERHLDVSEQPFEREMELDNEWSPMERGWVKRCAMVLLEHLDGAAVEIAVRTDEPDLLLFPGEHQRLSAPDPSNWQLRAVGGAAVVKVVLIPC